MADLIRTIQNASITLPAMEVVLLVIIVSICMVLCYNKTGLITSYIFAYKWGFKLFMGWQESFLTTYLVFGSVVCILAVVTMIQSHRSEQ